MIIVTQLAGIFSGISEQSAIPVGFRVASVPDVGTAKTAATSCLMLKIE